MNNFHYKNGSLYAEQTPLDHVAKRYGSPVHVYSQRSLLSAWREFDELLRKCEAGANALVCYSVKANSNLTIMRLFADHGAGFDIVSGGELARVKAAVGNTAKVVFSGVGKRHEEIEAALQAGILCFNVESEAELHRINDIARQMGKRAPVSLRVNPNVDARTHPYISTGLLSHKFGIAWENSRDLYRKAASLSHIDLFGIDCHIGSQMLDHTPLSDALELLLQLIEQLTEDGIELRHINMGGGLGIAYHHDESTPSVSSCLAPILDRLKGRNLRLLLEPGRRLVGQAGVMLTRVEYLKYGKTTNFAIVDAAMNDLLRPSLYDAWHEISPLEMRDGAKKVYDIVGPICESGDFLATSRSLAISPGDLLAVHDSGAYCMSMSSNYNTRPRAAEVLVDGSKMRLIRRRETYGNLLEAEIGLAPK